VRTQQARGQAKLERGNHEDNHAKFCTIWEHFPHTASEFRAFGMTDLQRGNCKENLLSFGKTRPEQIENAKNISDWIKQQAYAFSVHNLRVTHAFYDEGNTALITDVQKFNPAAPLYIGMMEDRYGTSVKDVLVNDNAKVLHEMKKLCSEDELRETARLEAKYGRPLNLAVTETTKGRLYHLNRLNALAPELVGVDKRFSSRSQNYPRIQARIKPWVTSAEMVENLGDILVLPEGHLSQHLKDEKAVAKQVANQVLILQDPDILTICGHYGLEGEPCITNPKSLCLDFKDYISGYRYTVGDTEFRRENLFFVPK
ncbi:MAG: hypothetical protein JWM96_1106, partial [Alphaproteobacteria bacterium]|nr:hypothetical protein [Alphaproteobacteria bacterium]